MFYAVLIALAFAWIVVGALLVVLAFQRNSFNRLEAMYDRRVDELQKARGRNSKLYAETNHYALTLSETRTQLYEAFEARDNALRCLELVIDEASTKELAK